MELDRIDKTLSALRKIRPDVPVILTSGYDENRAMTGDHKEQPQAFLHKPYDVQTLQEALSRVLGES